MKNIILLLFSIFFASNSLTAQASFTFRSVNIPSSYEIKDMKFIDSLRGIATNGYQIFSTIDAGENWSLKFTTPTTSNFEVINYKQDSIIVTGFYGVTGPTNLSFLFNDSTFLLDNQPNNHNITYIKPIFFNDSMWSTEGRHNIGHALVVIKDASFRVIDSNLCSLDIYDNRISFFNGTHIKYSIDSSKTWSTITNIPISVHSQQTPVQTYFDGNSTIYIQKQGWFLNNYEDSAYVSYNLGNSWSRISNTPIPNRFHFIDTDHIVGVDSVNFLFSNNKGLSFTSIPYDSTFWYPKMWVHSASRYFIKSLNRGLLVAEGNLVTQVKVTKTEQLDFSVIPNPATHFFRIDMEKEQIDQLQIFDISGRVINESSTPETFFDISNYPNGIYFVSIVSNGLKSTKKLIISKSY